MFKPVLLRFFESHLLMYVRWMRACTYDSLNLSPPLRREVSQQALCFVLPCVGAYMLTCSWKCLVNPKSSISVSPPCFWPPSLQSEALMSDGMSWVSPFLTITLPIYFATKRHMYCLVHIGFLTILGVGSRFGTTWALRGAHTMSDCGTACDSLRHAAFPSGAGAMPMQWALSRSVGARLPGRLPREGMLQRDAARRGTWWGGIAV